MSLFSSKIPSRILSLHVALVSSCPWEYSDFLVWRPWQFEFCQVFCALSFSLGLSDVFLVVRLELQVWGKKTTRVKCCSHHTTSGRFISVLLTWITWLTSCLLDFSTVKLFCPSYKILFHSLVFFLFLGFPFLSLLLPLVLVIPLNLGGITKFFVMSIFTVRTGKWAEGVIWRNLFTP